MTGESAQYKRLEAWAREHGCRLFGFVLPDNRIDWRLRSRKNRNGPMRPLENAEVHDALTTAEPDLSRTETAARIAVDARANSIAWDSPHLTIFETSEERVEQIQASTEDKPLSAERWPEPKPFVIDELVDKQPTQTSKRVTEAALNAAQGAASNAWCPVALHRGRTAPEGCGSGVLIKHKDRWGVLTAAHVLALTANPEENLEDEPILTMISNRPGMIRKGTTKRGDATMINAYQRTFIEPGVDHGRLDIGIAHVHPDVAAEACEHHGRRPLDLDDVKEWTTAEPLKGLQIEIGAPADRRRVHPRFVETGGVHGAVKLYRSSGRDPFQYIALCVNGPEEPGCDQDRDYHGFSGAPIWQVRPKPGMMDLLTDESGRPSIDAFETPKLVGIIFYQKFNAHRENKQKYRGLRDEIWALHIDGRAIRLIEALLASEDADNNPVNALTRREMDDAERRWQAAQAAKDDRRTHE